MCCEKGALRVVDISDLPNTGNLVELLLKRALSRQVDQLFAYRAGVDEGTPPLLTFTLDEPTIKERDW